MNNPLGVSPSKGNQGTTRGKEKKDFPFQLNLFEMVVAISSSESTKRTQHLCKAEFFSIFTFEIFRSCLYRVK